MKDGYLSVILLTSNPCSTTEVVLMLQISLQHHNTRQRLLIVLLSRIYQTIYGFLTHCLPLVGQIQNCSFKSVFSTKNGWLEQKTREKEPHLSLGDALTKSLA